MMGISVMFVSVHLVDGHGNSEFIAFSRVNRGYLYCVCITYITSDHSAQSFCNTALPT